MSTKTFFLYLIIAALGIGVGVLTTLTLMPHAPAATHSADDGHGHGAEAATTPAEHSADDGHGHGATASAIPAGQSADDGHDHSTEITGNDWCAEHRVPESQCTLCHEELIAGFKASGDWCAGHGIPESHCRLCNPGIRFPQEQTIVAKSELYMPPDIFFPPNANRCETDRAVIQFASAETVIRAGVTLEPVLSSESSGEVLEIPAEIVFDETRTQALTVSIPATVTRWLREAGTPVTSQSPICEVDSPQMAALQADYLAVLTESRVDLLGSARADTLYSNNLISRAEYDEIQGETAMTIARLNGVAGQLRAAGMSEDQLEQIESKGISSRWQLRAGIDGSLLERRATLGVTLEAGSTIATVGDANALWIQGHIRERDAGRIRSGQKIEFASDGRSLDRVGGEVFWIAQYIDPQTRTVMVRARLNDTNNLARANRFGRMLVQSNAGSGALLVPKDAVQWEGCCNVVFVAAGENKFQPHKVSVERGDRSHYKVSSGVQAGEMVVVGGSYLLKTELMKGSMGTGCCGLEPEL